MPLELESLESAVDALRRAADTADRHADTTDEGLTETIRDGIIHQFKVAYELCWKFIQRWIRENQNPDDADFPRNRRELFRMAARAGLISDPLPWFEFAESRNLTSHTYDAAKAESGYTAARRFLPYAQELLARLREKNA